jgi:hypothetical protein
MATRCRLDGSGIMTAVYLGLGLGFYLGLGLGLGGCATRVQVAAQDPELAGLLAERPLIALGGVTVAPMVGGILAPADERDAADAMHRAFLTGRPDLVPWPPAVVADQLGEERWRDLRGEYGHLGRLRPDQLVPLLDWLVDCRFLAIARLTDDAIRSRTLDPAGPADEDEHRSPWWMSVNTERSVTVTLELFDLTLGRSVWQAEARARDAMRYEYEDRLRRDPNRYLQERLAAADGPDVLDRRGEFLRLPDLVDLIEQALGGLVVRLPQTAGR